ncbi:MAG: TIM barrel protein [Clostridiales bacterium]|nr:TIM barrel protein [Clostridiales bacterium]
MEIGFTSTTFRQIKSLEKIVEIAKTANADCVEWGGDIHVKNVPDAKEARALCEKAGVAVSSYGSYYVVGSADASERRRVSEIAHELGADTVRVWLGKKNSENTDEKEYKAILDDLLRLGECASQYGLNISPECHGGTFNNNTDAFLRIAEDARKAGINNLCTYFQSKYKNPDYDFERIERTLDDTAIVHISFSEQMREQFFTKKDSRYADKLIEKLLDCGFDKRILLEYTYFASPKFFVKDIQRLRLLTQRGDV